MNFKIYEFSNKPILYCDLLSFLKKVDSLFKPILSKRTDLHLFSRKLIELSEIVYITDETGDIIGLISFYANDLTTKISYITLVAVVPEYQGSGLSKILLQKCKEFCKQKEMRFIDLLTDFSNYKAIQLYEKQGFKRLQERKTNKLRFRFKIE